MNRQEAQHFKEGMLEVVKNAITGHIHYCIQKEILKPLEYKERNTAEATYVTYKNPEDFAKTAARVCEIKIDDWFNQRVFIDTPQLKDKHTEDLVITDQDKEVIAKGLSKLKQQLR